MKRETFSGFHPAVNLAFFLCVLGMSMFILQPVYLAISLLCGVAYLAYLRGLRGMLRQVGYLLPLLLAMAVLNPLFNHEGVSILFYLPNDNPVTLEAICYGLAASALMGACVVWFNCFNAVLTSDKLIYLFGRVVPAMSLLISMTLRFVPRFKNYLQAVFRTQQAMHRPETLKEKLLQAMSAFSATVSWAMEQSLICADSMKSRGYGLRGRSAFSIYRFDKRDGGALLSLSVLFAGALTLHLLGFTRWEYYPALKGELLGAVQISAYVCWCGVCLLPLMIDLWEDRKWSLFRSEI